jgi:PST family polysaccharide transporter
MESARKLLYYGGGHTLSRIFNNLAVQGDNIVVTRTLGVEMLGLYSRAYSLLNIPASLVGQVLDSVLFPLLSRHQDDRARLCYIYSNISVAIMLITVPITSLSVILSEEIIVFFLSERWIAVREPFAILMLSLFFRTAYKISDTLVRSLAAVYKRTVFQVIYAGMVISGAYAGHFYGLNGVAWAVGIAIVINYILMFGLSVRLIGIKIPVFIGMHVPAAVTGAAAFLLTKYAYAFIPGTWPALAAILAASAVYMILYAALLAGIAWRYFMPETREFFAIIIKSLIGRFGKRKRAEVH